MNRYIDLKKRNPFPYTCIKFGNYKYKIINDKFNNINKDFKMLLDDNKNSPRKVDKKKKSRQSLSINKILENLVSNSTKNSSNLIKKFNMNFQKNNNNKRFMSAIDINNYKKRKIKLLRLIRDKNKNNNTISLINNKSYIGRNNSNNFNNILSNSQNFQKDADFSTKSISNKTFFKRNINKREKTFIQRKSNSFLNSNENQNTNINSNLINVSSNAINDKELNENNNENEKSLIDDNNDNIFDTYMNISEDMKDVYKKIALKNLKLKINKYENSKQYKPNSYIIEKNLINPFHFVRKKFISKFEMDNFVLNNQKEENNNNIHKKKIIRRIYSSKKYNIKVNGLNKTLTPSRSKNSSSNSKSNDNTKILLKKINNIKKTIKVKKNILKKNKLNNIKSVDNVMDYFYEKHSAQFINQAMFKDIKNDITKYSKKIGRFIEKKRIFKNHLHYITKGDKIFQNFIKLFK